MYRAPPATVAIAKAVAGVDTTRDGFDASTCRDHAQAFERFHQEMTKTLCEHANPGTPGALAFSASLRAKQRADTGVSILALRSPQATTLARQQFIDAKQDAIAAMWHLGRVDEVNQ